MQVQREQEGAGPGICTLGGKDLGLEGRGLEPHFTPLRSNSNVHDHDFCEKKTSRT